MREVTRDPGHLGSEESAGAATDETTGEILQGEVLNTAPPEHELAILTVLMRIYDLNLAILSHLNKSQADDIFEAHERGEHYNPPIYIPTVNELENEQD